MEESTGTILTQSEESPRQDRPMQEAAPVAEPLPLDLPERIVSYSSGGKIYRHTFRRISPQEWANDFFSKIVAQFKRVGDEGYEQTLYQEDACLALYARAAVSAEGFKLREGDPPMNQWPSWPSCVPQNHRVTAVELLAQVVPSGEEQTPCPDGLAVAVDALWGESDRAGEMRQFRGLIHRFAYPSREHSRRFFTEKARSLVVGGSRAGTTKLLSAHGTMVKLYDELIQGVEGYSFAGRPLATREAVIREMDVVHKAVAVTQLFPATTVLDPRVKSQDAEE